MLPVSQEWRNAITAHRTRYIRNAMKAAVYIGAFDESASPDASLSANVGELYYSDFDNINSTDEQESSYLTLEKDTFRGDGVQVFAPKRSVGSYRRQGWITDIITDGNGDFLINPVITIQFSEPHSMIGLTLRFDPYNVASDFTITWYADGDEIDSYTVTGNTTADWTYELAIEDADEIQIEFTGGVPYRRVHLQNILFGIGYTYDSNQLIDFTLTRKNSPLSLSLPETSLSFGVFNENGKFNVDRTTSLVRFLKTDQKVTATMWYDTAAVADDIVSSHIYYDFETGNLVWDVPEDYEGSQLSLSDGCLIQSGYGFNMWMENGYLYAEDTPKWEQLKLCTLWLNSWNVEGATASFQCEDAIQRLNNIKYDESDYGNEELNDRLDALMSYAGYDNYEFSETEESVLAFPQGSVAELLQLSANLTKSTLEQDPEAKVIIRPRTEPEVDAVTASGTLEPWSSAASVTQSGNATYATLEVDFMTGDGSQTLMGTPYLDAGITWTGLPVNGLYTDASVTLELTGNATFGTLNVVFPSPFIPTEYRVQGFRESDGAYTQVYDKVFSGSTSAVTDVFDRIKRLVITILGCDKDQRARLKQVALGWDTGYDIVSEDIIDRPMGSILTSCKDVIVNVRSYDAEADKQLATADVIAGEETRITHKLASGVTASADNGTVTILESHGYYTIVECTEDAKVTLTGTEYTDSKAEVSRNVSLHGEDLAIDNPLITALPDDYLDWVQNYVERDTEFTFDTLGFPELEAADLIQYKGEPAQIISHVLTFNSGACRSKFVVRKE